VIVTAERRSAAALVVRTDQHHPALQLGFGVGSIPFSNVDKAEGSLLVEYGLSLRWLTVYRHIASSDNTHPTSTNLWKTDKFSFELSSLVLDVAVAALAGGVLTLLSVRILRHRSKWSGSLLSLSLS